ncbi:cell envelope integrity protein TolA [Lutibacter sp.]|uniref:cell envelope integrity protein TolA n=1 Tax=Lutibacter sp. TaxID=1925666 RepID=UPI003564C139
MSNFLDTDHKRKSAVLTSLAMSLLVVSLFFFGMTYLDPPEEYGIALNFGTSEVGMGNIQPTEPLRAAPQEVAKEQQEAIKEQVTQTAPKVAEEVLTQNTEDAIVIKKQLEAKKKADEVARKVRAQQEAIAKQQAEEFEKRKKLDALIGGVSNSNGTATGGQGDDNTAGDKGKITGDPNANGYYGNGGGGGGGDYQLGNRKPISRPKPNYICDEEGLVVVSIEVNVYGKVIHATPGIKGSTNTAACLLSQAKEAALNTTWQPDSNAPSKQIGVIKYRFSLSQ